MRSMLSGISILLLALGSGCVNVPDVAPPSPTPPINGSVGNLEAKAQSYLFATRRHVNAQGLLLYKGWNPQTWATKRQDYFDSHDVADAPAWQGRFMAALALKSAVDGTDVNDDLARLADGLLAYYDITGVSGVFGRCYLADYTGPRLPWMEDEQLRPTKWWRQEADGRWWRTGLAKNHLNGAVNGCGLPLILEHLGQIKLRDDVRQKLLDVMLPAVRRLVHNGYRIADYDGKPTEFGDLRPEVIPQEYVDLAAPFVGFLGDISEEDLNNVNRPLNGFNMMLVLPMLKTCGLFDPALKAEYERVAPEWAKGIKLSLKALGFVIARVGHWKIGKPSYSDMEAVAFAATNLMLLEGEDTPVGEAARAGMRGLWDFMQYEQNPAFTFPYQGLVDPTAPIAAEMKVLTEFPNPEQKYAISFTKVETDQVQPIRNRPPKSNYWKSSPFVRADPPFAPALNERGSKQYYSGQDYLIAYYLARYFKR